ncbi:MAG: hypothetical protein RMJ56_17880 [Gemmataceae bacterium]|nr:hypothetical protein [Gemmata sp.]MDW8199469.1 hypothetical protein [Gemmataceae bacterium]
MLAGRLAAQQLALIFRVHFRHVALKKLVANAEKASYGLTLKKRVANAEKASYGCVVIVKNSQTTYCERVR